jgi:DNA-binding HxlR family transcriptional regulator
MTTLNENNPPEGCPIEGLLKTLSGKWKPQIFQLAAQGPLRFNSLLRQLPQSNKQSLSVALKEMEEAELLVKTIIQQKPLHIEYELSSKGLAMIEVFRQLEAMLLNPTA